MGFKLYIEVMDHWQDAGLTRAERDDLLVLAENANDATRETFGSVHEDYILRRAGKLAQSWRNGIDALKRKKALEYAERNGRQMSGRPGQHAVYRLPVLCPDAPHDGYHGFCTRPERVLATSTHQEDRCVTTASTHQGEMGNQSEYPSERMGTQTDPEWVTRASTPTPPPPVFNEPPRDQPPPPPASPPWLVTGEEAEAEFAKKEDPELQDRAETFVDKLPYDRRPSRSERAELLRLVALALATGWPEDDLLSECERALDDVRNRIGLWIKTRLKPEELGDPPKAKFAPPAADGLRPKCWRCDGNRTLWSYRGSCGCPFCSLPVDAPPAEEDALWLKARALGIEKAGVEREDGTLMQWPPRPVSASVPKPRESGEHRGWRQDPNAVYGRPTRPRRESYSNPTDNSGYHEPL